MLEEIRKRVSDLLCKDTSGHGNLCIDESVVKNWINGYLPDFDNMKGKIK